MTAEISWVERFYTHFIGRDFCYLFGGGLFICVVEYTYWGKIFLPNGFSLELIGFLMLSYFVGVAISHTGTNLNFPGKMKTPAGYSSSLLFLQDLIENYDERVLNQHERYVFFMNVGKSFGLSSLLGGILMIIFALSRWMFNKENPAIEYFWLALSLLVFGILMLFDARKMIQGITETRAALVKDIVSKHQRK